MTANHAKPAPRRRQADRERSAAEGTPGAMQGLFGRADMHQRAPAGSPGAKQIVLPTVRPDLHTDFQDP